MSHTGLFALKDHDNLAYGAPVDQLATIMVLNPANDEEDPVLVEVVRLIMAHHETNLD